MPRTVGEEGSEALAGEGVDPAFELAGVGDTGDVQARGGNVHDVAG